MLNSAFYNSLLHWPQKEDETEKTAFINPISAIKPVTGNLARTAFGGAKNLLKDSWKGLSGIDKTLTVGLPLATTVPSLFNKKDQVGNSRANRLSSTAGNIIGGIGGTGLGNQLAKKVTTPEKLLSNKEFLEQEKLNLIEDRKKLLLMEESLAKKEQAIIEMEVQQELNS